MIKTIYPYFLGLMSTREITIQQISECIGKNCDTVRRKIAGTTPFTLGEAMDIQEAFFCDIAFKELWKEENISRSA